MEFSKIEIACFKRIAQNVYPLIKKREKIMNKVAELRKEYEALQAQIDVYDAPIKEATGGFGSYDLFERVVVNTTTLDKNGNPVKQTKFVLKYPDTIIPPFAGSVINDANVSEKEQTTSQEMENEQEVKEVFE